MPKIRFAYDPEVAARFPSVAGGVIHATGVSNGPSPQALVEAFQAEQEAVLARVGETPLSELPTLAAWRRAFRAFGVDPTAYRSAAEALLRRLTKQGSIPSINALVDIGNLVGDPLRPAGRDVRPAHGSRARRPCDSLPAPSRSRISARETARRRHEGEVIFVDDAGLVSARRWCWRQSAESASGPDTTEVLVTVEGHHDGAEADVRAAAADLETLLRTYAGPSATTSGVVTAQSPIFET